MVSKYRMRDFITNPGAPAATPQPQHRPGRALPQHRQQKTHKIINIRTAEKNISALTRGRAEGRAAQELQSAVNPRAKDKMQKIITWCGFYLNRESQ